MNRSQGKGGGLCTGERDREEGSEEEAVIGRGLFTGDRDREGYLYRRQGQRGVYIQETGIWRSLCTEDRDREGFIYRNLGYGGGYVHCAYRGQELGMVYEQETGIGRVFFQETGIGSGSCTGYRDREGFMFRRQG